MRKREDIDTLEKALNSNRKLTKIASIAKKGPRTTKLIIKNIPISVHEDVLLAATKQQYGEETTLVKYYPYKKSNAYSQIISVTTSEAVKQLRHAQPKTKIGHSYYQTQLYTGTLRCYNCHAFGHSAPSCKNPTFCGKCGYEGHHTEDCRVKDADKNKHACINCITYCDKNSVQMDVKHTAFSTICPIYRDYLTATNNNQLALLLSQSQQNN